MDFNWKKNGPDQSLPRTVTLNPFAIDELADLKLNKSKKILLCGKWQEMKYWYHYLLFRGYRVYLLK